MYMNVLTTWMLVYYMYVWCLRRPKEAMRYPRIRATDSCEFVCRCWELNLGPLEEQPVLLRIEPSLQPPNFPELLRSVKENVTYASMIIAISSEFYLMSPLHYTTSFIDWMENLHPSVPPIHLFFSFLHLEATNLRSIWSFLLFSIYNM